MLSTKQPLGVSVVNKQGCCEISTQLNHGNHQIKLDANLYEARHFSLIAYLARNFIDLPTLTRINQA